MLLIYLTVKRPSATFSANQFMALETAGRFGRASLQTRKFEVLSQVCGAHHVFDVLLERVPRLNQTAHTGVDPFVVLD